MRTLTALDEPQVRELLGRDEFFWLDLTSPGEDDVNALASLLDLHPLAVKSVSTFPQRPKLDDYERYVVLIFYGVGGEGREALAPLAVHMLISGSYVVTIHQERCEMFDGLRGNLEQRPEGSETSVVYRVLDALADSFFPALGFVDEEIDSLEDAVVTRASEEQLQRIFQLKRDLVNLRRVATPQRDLLARAIDGIKRLPGLEPGTRDYFRDVYDHMIRVSDLIDSYRDLLTGALDVYLSTVSNRLNRVMERLTLVATVFLPLTVVTGFFGQNFGWMVDRIDTFAAFALLGVGGMIAPIVLLFVMFRRAGYI
jgi:magnesium transporter